MQAGNRPPPEGDEPDSPVPGVTDTTALLRRAKAGDAAALDALCQRVLPRLSRWASGRLPLDARGLVDTHDVVQESLVRTIAKIPSFEPAEGGAFNAYLRQAVLNRVRDEIRRTRRREPGPPLTGSEPDPSPTPLEELVGREPLERYASALARLRDEDREAIVGRIELGLAFEELAEVLGKPSADAARMAVNRALVKLAREMGGGSEPREDGGPG